MKPMTLDQFIASLERWRDMRPGNGDLPVVTNWGQPAESVASMTEIIIRPMLT